MKVLLTITKDKRDIFCGHAFLMDNLLIAHGRSVEAVEQSLKQTLSGMYEISPEAYQFVVRRHYTLKAANVVSRLKKTYKHQQMQVWFDSRYFDVS